MTKRLFPSLASLDNVKDIAADEQVQCTRLMLKAGPLQFLEMSGFRPTYA